MSKTYFPLLALLLLTACGEAPRDTHPDQPVTKRKAVFKQMLRTLEPLGMAARGRQDYDEREFLAAARELRKLAEQPWSHFTPDSNYPPTRAKAEVWSQADEFAQSRQRFLLAADRLVKAAETGGQEAVRPAVDEVEKSCQACHRRFRL